MLEITSNGSKWAGEKPDTIEQLLEALENNALDRTFENYGNFIIKCTPEYWEENSRQGFMRGMKHLIGTTHFFGNFYSLSHVFNIRTDEPDIVSKLTKAIRANQQRPDYQSQPKPEKRAKK